MHEEPRSQGESHGHVPVLLEASVEALQPAVGDTMVDCTAGRGGHASALAHAVQPGGCVVLFDLDEGNLAHASTRVREEQGLETISISRSFASVGRELTRRGLQADGLLADLGFASNQMDDSSRGLSLKGDGPLDMRLDRRIPVSAADLVARLDERELRDLIRRFGEDPAAGRIARKIVEERVKEPINQTAHLARLVREAYGSRARESRVHPATRTFQALRIAVNDELGALEALLAEIEVAVRLTHTGSPGWLAPGARLALISFHSLEDRMIKQRFAKMDQDGLLESRSRKPVRPSDLEVRVNARARSAKLRWATVGTSGP